MKNLKKLHFVFFCLAFALFAGIFASCSNTVSDAEIASFTFYASKNSGIISSNISGKVDSSAGTITVYLPQTLYSSDERSNLKATVLAKEGSSLETDIDSLDFAYSPLEIAVSQSGITKTYVLNIEKESSAVTNGTLLFTEYYSGQTAPFKGANNQYLEITNKSSSAVDLSSVSLTRHVWEDGSRAESKDICAQLSGTLPAGASLVLYSQRCNWFSSKTDSSSSVYKSDRDYSQILETNGIDGFTLESGGKVIDSIGFENGEGNGWNWGAAKLMQRKRSVSKYTKFAEYEWISSPSTNSSSDVEDTAGTDTENSTGSEKDLTYFALEELSPIVYGSIDTSARTVTIEISDEYKSKKIKFTASTNGSRIRYNGKEVTTGVSSARFNTNFQLTVYDNAGGSSVYTVKTNFVHYNHSSAASGTYKLATALPSDGDIIMIYYASSGVVLGSTSSGSGIVGVETSVNDDEIDYSNGMASLCCTVDSNGNYIFTCGGKYLVSSEYSSSTGTLKFDSAPGNYGTWKFSKSGDEYLVKNVNAASGSSSMQIEYYNGYFYTYKTGNEIQIYIKED